MSSIRIQRSAQEYLKLAEKFIEDEREDKAIYYLRRAVNKGDTAIKAKALGMLAYRYVVLDDIEMSDKALYELLSINPKSPRVYDMLLGNAFGKGDIDLFRFYMQEQTKLSGKPFCEDLPELIMPVKSYIQSFFDSIRAKSHGFSTKQTRAASAIGKALAYLHQGDWDNCMQELDKAQNNIGSDEAQRVFLLVKAKCSYLMGQTQNVASMLDKAYQFEKDNLITQSYMLLYTDKKYDDDFVSHFGQLAHNTEIYDSDIVVELVRMFLGIGKLEVGQEIVDIYLKEEPLNRRYLRLKGVLCYNLGDIEGAVKAFNKLNCLYGDYTDARCYLKVAKGLGHKINAKMHEFHIDGMDEYCKKQVLKVEGLSDVLDNKILDSDMVDWMSWLFNSCQYDEAVRDKIEEIALSRYKRFRRFLERRLLVGESYITNIKQDILYILIRYYSVKSVRYIDGSKFRKVDVYYPNNWWYMDNSAQIAYSRAVTYAIVGCGEYDVKRLVTACEKINEKILQNGVIIEKSNMLTRLILESLQDKNIYIDNRSPWLQVDMEEYNSLVQNLLI